MKRSRITLLVIVTVLIVAAVAVAIGIASRRPSSTTSAPAPSVAPTGTSPGVGLKGVGIKAVHDPGTVTVDEQLAPGQCAVRTVDAAAGDFLPDPACTPGAIDPAVTEDSIGSTICTSGYTATVRPPASATDKFKTISLAAYGLPRDPTIELDHLVSLELGGSNTASNLWPEPNRSGANGTTNPKDAVETKLKTAVCAHRITLAAAQQAIAVNWVSALADLGL